VQHATDLIRTDNELTRLLVDVRPSDEAGAAIYLRGLAVHAKTEADALKDDQARIPVAIAYYRIAATAYWRGGKSEDVNDLFEATESGTELCASLGEKAPDRDCLFLQLVIPFAGLESLTKTRDISALLVSVNFNDNKGTQREIDTMGVIRESLTQSKRLVQKILAVGADSRLLSHPGMREYYCYNARKALDLFDNQASSFATKIRDYGNNISNNTPPLNMTLNEARELRKLEKDSLSFCKQ
jgi:hypothetical protein